MTSVRRDFLLTEVFQMLREIKVFVLKKILFPNNAIKMLGGIFRIFEFFVLKSFQDGLDLVCNSPV